MAACKAGAKNRRALDRGIPIAANDRTRIRDFNTLEIVRDLQKKEQVESNARRGKGVMGNP